MSIYMEQAVLLALREYRHASAWEVHLRLGTGWVHYVRVLLVLRALVQRGRVGRMVWPGRSSPWRRQVYYEIPRD